jgi:membrane-bound lytic murein transglycosylase F
MPRTSRLSRADLIGVGAAIVMHAFVTGCAISERRLGDLDEIGKFDEIRVVVRPGFFEAPRSSDGAFDEAGLVRQFAARLGVGVRWVEASRNDQVAEFLRTGVADLGVSRFSPASLIDDDLEPTAPVGWVEDFLIAGPDFGVDDRAELHGKTVHVLRSSLNTGLRSSLAQLDLNLMLVQEEISVEKIMNRVIEGRYQLAVVDSAIVRASPIAKNATHLDSIGDRRALVWAVRTRNPRLRSAIDDFLFAEGVLARSSKTTTCRDLERVKQAGVLRLITRNSPTTFTVDRGGLEGFEYELAVGFARSLGVRLELSIPPPDVDPVDWLPAAPSDQGGFLVSVPYRSIDLVSVVSVRAKPPSVVDALAGVRVAASRPAAELCSLLPLRAPIRTRITTSGTDAFNALQDVAHGRVPVAVVDEDAARLELANRTDLQPGCVVLPDIELVWLLNTSSPNLYREVNRYLRTVRTSGVVRQLVLNHLGSWQQGLPRNRPAIPDGALTPYDELLKWVGRRWEIDWRLLASLMYEESRFDPTAVGPGGSAGLFQFMPFTWRELGVEDPHHPREAAEAGAHYLRRLIDGFEGLPPPDRVAMAIASYNVGPRHVFDARRLAREMGFNPDRWVGSVETAMLLLDDPEVARRFPAGVCRCRRAVGYTRRILQRYHAYAEQFPPS